MRRRAETVAAAAAPELRTRGDLTVDATWSGGDDIDTALITPDGTRISWMGGRTTMVGRDARAAGRELIGVSRATLGNYVIEISRTGRDGTEHAVSGDLRIRALETRDAGSLLTWYKRLLALRSEREALREGSLELLPGESRDVLRFDRIGTRERLAIAANLGDSSATVDLDEGAVLLAASESGCVVRGRVVTLPPHSAVVAVRG